MYKVEKMLLKVSEVAFNIEADKAMKEAKSIHYFYNDDGTVALFICIDDKKDVNEITKKIKKYNEDFTKEKYKKHNEILANEIDYFNGVKVRPQMSVLNGMG